MSDGIIQEERERLLFEYFIVAGLNDEKKSDEFPAQSSDGKLNNGEAKAPITDICVVISSAGETTPVDYERIETTPSGYPANLNHGSLRSAACFVCFKRGYHKPPLIDLGILDESKGEKPMADAIVIDKTPYGLSANISNSNSQSLFFTIRRAQPDAPPHQLVITDICVILENKNEQPPHTYYRIPKNLNRSMLGSDVYICFKKSQMICKRLAYRASVLDCFPPLKNEEDSILVQNVPKFFLPMGASIEAWPERCIGAEKHSSARTFSTCAYTKYYGASVTFYEPYTDTLSEEQLEKLDLGEGTYKKVLKSSETLSSTSSKSLDDKEVTEEDENISAITHENYLYYCNKAICVVSRYPFFEPFRRFLFFLLNSVTVGSSKIPIERYISHLMYEVPFPSPSRPRILIELGNDMIELESSDDSQIPFTGANFILVHSLRPWLLASVTETFCAMIFPFSWHLPYIPQCPLEVADIFHAPLSFMAGVDSRYFDLKDDPPSDVTCFDLDTATISKSTVRKFYKLDMLPKKPLKRLRTVLDDIFKACTEKISSRTAKDNERLHLQLIQSETAIREAFLKFICSLMDGYIDYLRPLLCSPKSEEELDINRLFDWNLFLHSRDKHSVGFYQKFRETTCFIRFIEERSGALSERGGNGPVDRSIYYIFFDDCITKIRAEIQNVLNIRDKAAAKKRVNNLRLLDTESIRANRTVVIQAPQMLNPEFKDTTFTYTSFPHSFSDKLFERDYIRNAVALRPPQHSTTKLGNKNFIILRTRQEIRKSMADTTKLYQQNIMLWPRSVLFFAYSIWFLQLPSMLALAKSKKKMLILGLRVISRMEQLLLPIHDQICYRVLMQLCGDNNHPELAVHILRKMLRSGIVPNAVTYKIYHQALIKSKWPDEKRISAINAWRRLRMVLEICIRFRMLLPRFETSSDFIEQESFSKNTSGEIVDNEVDEHNIVCETGIIKDEKVENEDENSSIFQNHHENNITNTEGDPLGAEILNNNRKEINTTFNQPKNSPLMEKVQSCQKKSPNGKNAIIKLKNTSFISPSREKFMKEHSVSPFALEDSETSFADKISLNSERKKRRSLRLGGSWFKNFASNSPIFNTLINRKNLEKMSRDGGSSINSDGASTSALSVTPNLFTLANKMRKKALRTYNEVLGPATELLERSGINPARILNEAKLNLSKSYQNADQSLLSEISASNNNLLCSKNAKDPISISYWMQDVIPDDNTELKNVWIRKEQNDNSISPEDFLDVFLCSSSICSNCEQALYDDEITLGWVVDDANLNSVCPHCHHNFLPSLKVCIRVRQQQPFQIDQQQSPNSTVNSSFSVSDTSGEIVQAFTVPYVNPLVLRRELETLLIEDGQTVLGRPSMRISHPIIFWNMFYYCRRLELPTHLLTWVSPAVVINCIANMLRLPSSENDDVSAQRS